MKKIIESIYNKQLEIHYNNWETKRDSKTVKIELKGKIRCPVVNEQISSLCCSKIMDNEGWPRNINPEICKECNCFVYLSIKKFQDIKKGKPSGG